MTANKDNERRIAQDRIRIEMCLSVLESALERQASIQDPASRYLLIVDKLCVFLDIAFAALKVASIEADDRGVITAELKDRADKVTGELKKQLSGLLKWIQEPTLLSPDHPIGNNLMETCRKDFQTS